MDGCHRFLHAPEAGDGDGADPGIARHRFVQHRHAVAVGQLQVDDQAVVGEPVQPFDRVGGVGRLHRKAVRFERLDDRGAEIEVVFNDEDSGRSGLRH
jgi:hypothetical protein